MRLAHVLTLNAILALASGIAFAVYGPLMIAFYDIPEIPAGNALLYWNVAAFARMFGAGLFGFGILLWAVRGLPEEPQTPPGVLRGIVFALLFANGMGLFVAITQQMSVWLSPAGWATAAVFAVLLLAYAYFLIAKPGNTQVSSESSMR